MDQVARPWLLAGIGLALLLVLTVFPNLDLRVSSWFYRPGAGFFLGRLLPLRLVYEAVPLLTWGVAVLLILGLLHAALRRPAVWERRQRAMLFLLLSLIIGPGLLTNTLLKDHWGRARPSQVTEFGGHARFTPALEPADQCGRNCSFPAGHPAMAFYPLSLLFLARRRRPRTLLALVGAGLLVGLVRIAQGGHFLSDVIAAGLLVSAVACILDAWIMGRGGPDVPALVRASRGMLHRTGASVRHLWAVGRYRAVLLAGALLLVVIVCFGWIDLPLAIRLHQLDPAIGALFQRVTQLGVGTGWLVGSGVLTILLWIASWQSDLLWVRREIRRWRDSACFFFLSVAASGLLTDGIKLLLGRARPRLYFSRHLYGLEWFAGRASEWSMPSGHATTIAAVATALAIIWPRHVAAYVLLAILVALSRVIITVHYLSDVILGGAIGATVTLLLARHSGLAPPRLWSAAPPQQRKAGVSDTP